MLSTGCKSFISFVSASYLARFHFSTKRTIGVNFTYTSSIFLASIHTRESSGASHMQYRKLVSFCAKKAGTINNKTISNTGILVFTIYLPIEYLVGTHCLCFVLSKYGYSSIIKAGKNTMTLKKLSNIPFT